MAGEHVEFARRFGEVAVVAEHARELAAQAEQPKRDLEAHQAGPFDLLFIDADKQRIPEYFRAALSLSRRWVAGPVYSEPMAFGLIHPKTEWINAL